MGASNLNGIREWFKTIDRHYQSLDDFEDAQTIRVQLDQVWSWMAEDTRIERTIVDPAGKDEWREAFSEERIYAHEVEAKLQGWLEKRGLTHKRPTFQRVEQG